jgi:biopolymer transport protein ExbB/TolQ
MNSMTQSILTTFSSTSVLLLAPVMVMLALMLAVMCWIIGWIAGDALDRLRYRRRWKRLLDSDDGFESVLEQFRSIPLFGDIDRFRNELGDQSPGHPSSMKLVENIELKMARRISWLTFMTRIGPVLGLIGTLLPMGPALRSLTAENLAALAYELEIAFMSTIYGLIVGVFAYSAGIIRKNWCDQDLSDLEFFLSKMQGTGDQRQCLRAENSENGIPKTGMTHSPECRI